MFLNKSQVGDGFLADNPTFAVLCVDEHYLSRPGHRSGDLDEQSRTGRAKTSFDAALVWPSLQTMDRLRAIHSFGNNQQIAKPSGFSRPLTADARLNDDKADAPFVDYLHALYADNPPDLILAIGAPAANFVQRYRKQIFPGTPMLFTAVEARRVQYDKLTHDDTFVAVAHDFPASFENILRVLPRTTTIAIVNGASPNETFWLGELQRETAHLTDGLNSNSTMRCPSKTF